MKFVEAVTVHVQGIFKPFTYKNLTGHPAAARTFIIWIVEERCIVITNTNILYSDKNPAQFIRRYLSPFLDHQITTKCKRLAVYFKPFGRDNFCRVSSFV